MKIEGCALGELAEDLNYIGYELFCEPLSPESKATIKKAREVLRELAMAEKFMKECEADGRDVNLEAARLCIEAKFRNAIELAKGE